MHKNVRFKGIQLRQEPRNLNVSLKLKAIEGKAVNWEARLEGVFMPSS
jgi:hypothetical protein